MVHCSYATLGSVAAQGNANKNMCFTLCGYTKFSCSFAVAAKCLRIGQDNEIQLDYCFHYFNDHFSNQVSRPIYLKTHSNK